MVPRKMELSDLETIAARQCEVAPGAGRTLERLHDMLQLFPPGCWVVEQEGLCGWLFSHPWTADGLISEDRTAPIPPGSDCYAIDLLGVMPDARRAGAEQVLVTQALHLAQWIGLSTVNVRVPPSAVNAWRRHGFVASATRITSTSVILTCRPDAIPAAFRWHVPFWRGLSSLRVASTA